MPQVLFSTTTTTTTQFSRIKKGASDGVFPVVGANKDAPPPPSPLPLVCSRHTIFVGMDRGSRARQLVGKTQRRCKNLRLKSIDGS
jgi:hypothetical protein